MSSIVLTGGSKLTGENTDGLTVGDLAFRMIGAFCIMAMMVAGSQIGCFLTRKSSPWDNLPLSNIIFYDGGFTMAIVIATTFVAAMYYGFKYQDSRFTYVAFDVTTDDGPLPVIIPAILEPIRRGRYQLTQSWMDETKGILTVALPTDQPEVLRELTDAFKGAGVDAVKRRSSGGIGRR
jgi:hypothetical protein